MAPLNAIDTWSMRTSTPEVAPKAKCYLVGEGANTEFWYLEALATRLAKEGKPELIELKPVERTGKERNQSSPRKLAQQAREIRQDIDGTWGFEEGHDRVVIFFDADIYRNNPSGYAADLREFLKYAEVAVTYPSFELFLLLHIEDAYEELILPHEQEILENGHAEGTHRRFVEKLASDALHMNVKKNPNIANLAAKFELAAEAEKKLNQNPEKAIGCLSSNVALTLEQIVHEGQRTQGL